MIAGRVLALVVLARSLVKVLIGRLFGRKTGLPLFHENYDADGLPALEAAERERMPQFERCIACGRCDIGESERIAASKGRYAGLMPIVLASTRNMPDYEAAVEALSFIPQADLVRKEKVCPTGVPFVELAKFVRAKALATKHNQAAIVHE
ncbi:MAG TPA: hypothetical protein PK156_51190 [Polyangium sp.]|nr:hypothetical protein [Polyangium sp.]